MKRNLSRRALVKLGACALLSAGLMAGVPAPSFASTPNTVTLYDQGYYQCAIVFPLRHFQSLIIDHGSSWTLSGLTGNSDEEAKVYGYYSDGVRFWIANFYFNDADGLTVTTYGTTSNPRAVRS